MSYRIKLTLDVACEDNQAAEDEIDWLAVTLAIGWKKAQTCSGSCKQWSRLWLSYLTLTS